MINIDALSCDDWAFREHRHIFYLVPNARVALCGWCFSRTAHQRWNSDELYQPLVPFFTRLQFRIRIFVHRISSLLPLKSQLKQMTVSVFIFFCYKVELVKINSSIEHQHKSCWSVACEIAPMHLAGQPDTSITITLQNGKWKVSFA